MGAAAQLWMLQGGPGITSAVLETSMLSVYNKAEGTFDVCTVDFRGTAPTIACAPLSIPRSC